MKRLMTALIASYLLTTPMALAQTPHAFEVADGYGHKRKQVEHHVDKRIEKRVERRVIIKRKHWARGHRLSPTERRHMVYVGDYRRYRLRPPSHGQQWVRVDNDFLLISLATGVIVSLTSAY